MDSMISFLPLENNSQINVEYFKSEEKTENGIIYHNFVGFNLSDIEISDILTAKIIAKKISQTILPYLDNLIKNANNESDFLKYKKTKNWINKKAIWHPAWVEKCTHQLIQKMNESGELSEIPLKYEQIYQDLSIIAILHDIGRLSEIDIAQGIVTMKRSGLNKSHAAISFDMLKHIKIKPEILLSIKYHEFADIDEAVTDDIYKSLPLENKKIAEFYIRVLQDMDKTANLLERSKFGIKKCAEFFDSHYVQDYNLTEEYFEKAIAGNYLDIKGGHLLDAMMHFVTWIYSIHFTKTKEILSEILTDFFWQMYIEALREYDISEDKDVSRLKNTITKIKQLEDYVIITRMNRKVNKSNRKKIINKINEIKDR